MRPSSTIHGRYSLTPRCARLSPRLGLALTLAAGILVAPAAVEAQSLTLFDAPAWAHYFCDSSEPDPNGAVAAIQGTHCYPSLTVPSGAVVQLTNLDASTVAAPDAPRGEWLVYVDGPCTIAGTISASALNLTWADGGGSGGGGGAASDNAGIAGHPSNGFGAASFPVGVRRTAADLNQIHVAAGGNGGAPGENGTPGSTPTAASQRWTAVTADQLVLGGSSGGSGGKGTHPGGKGGNGGGAVVLICADSISFTGTIDVSGANGEPGVTGTNPSGGGGGGGGGIVLMATPDYPANSGAIVLSGGQGGSAPAGAGAGRAGGAGWFKQFTLD